MPIKGAKKELEKKLKNIKGVTVSERENRTFTKDEKKRIKEMQRQLKGLNP